MDLTKRQPEQHKDQQQSGGTAQDESEQTDANNLITNVLNQNIKTDVVVIQKYIEKPLLIQGRKFDMRLWVMVTQDHRCYLFKEGYIRMSSQKFSLQRTQQEDLFIHLTNNAIQKWDANYGAFEEGNILSYSQASVSQFES